MGKITAPRGQKANPNPHCWQNGAMSTLETPLKKELGDRTAAALAKAFGIETVGDLLHHYPRRYVARGELSDIDELTEGEEATVLAIIG